MSSSSERASERTRDGGRAAAAAAAAADGWAGGRDRTNNAAVRAVDGVGRWEEEEENGIWEASSSPQCVEGRIQ